MHKCIAVSQMQPDTGAADPSARQHQPPLFAAPVQQFTLSSPPPLSLPARSVCPESAKVKRSKELFETARVYLTFQVQTLLSDNFFFK